MLEEKIANTIKKYNLINNKDSVVVGVSGGPDSMCLLKVLENIRNSGFEFSFNIVVAHVNHMLRKDAEEETKYVEEFCKKNNIDCYVRRQDVNDYAKINRIGTEEAGREIRYDFFNEIAIQTNSNKIALAHHMNDKVETVLMNIIRGSGTSGLKGIEPKRNDKYIRPLIEIQRYEIEKYCEENKLFPRIDKSNFDNSYTRNRIRNVLIPLLKQEFNPNIVEAINKLSELSTDEQNYLEKIVHNIYDLIVLEESDKEIILNKTKFNEQDLVIKRRIILYTISKLFDSTKNIEKIHIQDIIRLCDRNIGNKYLMPNKNVKIFVKKGKIFFTSIQ